MEKDGLGTMAMQGTLRMKLVSDLSSSVKSFGCNMYFTACGVFSVSHSRCCTLSQ